MIKRLAFALAAVAGIPTPRVEDWEWWEIAMAVVLALAAWAIFGD
jgi:hypothetical protein